MTSPISTLYLARMHREDLQRDAARQRLVAAARGSRPEVRQRLLSGIGAAFIACGHWLQGRAPLAAHAAPSAEAVVLSERGSTALAARH